MSVGMGGIGSRRGGASRLLSRFAHLFQQGAGGAVAIRLRRQRRPAARRVDGGRPSSASSRAAAPALKVS